MGSKKQDLLRVMKDLQVNENLFSEEDIKLFEKGGYTVSDTESINDTQSFKDSLTSPVANISKKMEIDNRVIPETRAIIPRSQELDILAMKTKYASIISMLEKQNSFLTAEIRRLTMSHEAEKRKIASQNQIEQEKLINEIRSLRTRNMQTESQVPLIKEAFQQVRDMMNGLIPETTYLRLRDIPERDLQPSEWVLLQAWDMIYPYKQELEYQKREILNLREDIKNCNIRMAQQLTELEHSNRLLFDKEEDYKRHVLNYENSRKQYEIELKQVQEDLEVYRQKSLNYDTLQRDYKKVEQEKFLLQERLGILDNEGDNNNKGGGGFTDLLKKQEDIRRQVDLLNADKMHLTKENVQLLEKNKRLEDRVDKLETELIQAKDQAQDYLYQLLNSKTATSVEFEKKINQELNSLREKHQHELEISKSNLIDVYEKQIRFLRESIEEQEIKTQSAQSALKEKQNSYDQLLLENRNLQRRVDNDMSEIRVQYRLKAEEYERLQTIYEETLANLKATKVENEMLRDKLNVLKSEYYKAELSSKEEYSTMKAQLAVAREQLQNYELIEKEIDQAIIQISQEDSFKLNGSDNIYLNTISQAPTSSKRRIQQALNLAQKLQSKQKEAESLQKKLREKEEELEACNGELNLARELVEKTNQPYSYLIAAIEEKEKEVIRYKQLLKKNDTDYQYLKAEHENLKEAYDRAEADIKKLIVKRENIHNIQNLLLSLVNNEQENVNIHADKIINDIKQILDSAHQIQPGTYSGSDPNSKSMGNKPQQSLPNFNIQKGTQGAPQWYQKLKSTLKK